MLRFFWDVIIDVNFTCVVLGFVCLDIVVFVGVFRGCHFYFYF